MLMGACLFPDMSDLNRLATPRGGRFFFGTLDWPESFASVYKDIPMENKKPPEPELKQNRDTRREETNRAFAQIRDDERKKRLEKTMRLKSLRLVKQ